MADLDRFPPHPGDKEPYITYLKPINDELWARQWLATERIYKETGILHTVNSGFRPYEEQVRFWRCYTCCCCNSCNLAARPGSSNHERGLAIDFSNAPRNIKRSREIYYESGIHFPIYGPKTEPWHGEMYDGRPGLLGGPAPPMLEPKRETQVALADNHVINGITLEAEIFQFPTLVRVRWNTGGSPLWPANQYVSLVDYLPHSPGPTPHWVNHVEVGEIPDGGGPRFVVLCKDTASHLACAAYQAVGNQGKDVIEFDLNSGIAGHPGWWPAG